MGARVLLAAESITPQELFPQNFSSRGAEVTCVCDGISARQLINDLDPDLLIAEISLSGVSGYELCEYVRESARHRQMPVILVDNQFEALNQAQACKAGVDIYLARPFEPERLAGTVDRLIRREKDDRSGGALYAPAVFTESLAVEPDPMYAEELKLREAAPDILTSEPADSARADRPYDLQNDVRLQGRPSGAGIRPHLSTESPRGRRELPALLWVILIGIIVGSMVLLARKSPRLDEGPTAQQGIVSASDATPEPEPSGDDAEAAPSYQVVEDANAVAGESPPSEAEEADERPVSEEAAQFPSPPSSSERATTEPLDPPSHSSVGATDRAPEFAADERRYGHSVTEPRRARTMRRAGAGYHARRGGAEMKQAGKKIGSGFKHFGIAGKNTAVWSGKKAGAGVKGFGKAVKGIFN
ncbi:MAG TPA: response regulator [Blastocatellia bacterium]|nr:response regulator [Blastocatellia bacterium]